MLGLKFPLECVRIELAPPPAVLLLLLLKCPLLSAGMTSNLTMHKGEFHQWRQSLGRVFKQMAEMRVSGRELIVLADESELSRSVPSFSTLICLLISRRGRSHCSWRSVRLEFPTLGDENCNLVIKSKVFPFY